MPQATLLTSFEVKRSKIKVTRPLKAVTENQPCLRKGNAYELQTSLLYELSTKPALTCADGAGWPARIMDMHLVVLAAQVDTCRGMATYGSHTQHSLIL